jgi:hypothetical protein
MIMAIQPVQKGSSAVRTPKCLIGKQNQFRLAALASLEEARDSIGWQLCEKAIWELAKVGAEAEYHALLWGGIAGPHDPMAVIERWAMWMALREKVEEGCSLAEFLKELRFLVASLSSQYSL